MEFYYDLQDGNYIWHRGPDDATSIGPEIAVLFDKNTGTLLTHGTPELVQQKYAKLSDAFKKIGEGDCLMILTGRVPLEKINKSISHSGTCHKIFAEEIAQVDKYKNNLSS